MTKGIYYSLTFNLGHLILYSPSQCNSSKINHTSYTSP